MNTTIKFEAIVKKAEDLAGAISSHDITVRYQDLVKQIKNNPEAQNVYERLVKIGKDINDAKENGTELDESFVLENDELKQDLQKMPLVREFVDAQKEYFEMMSYVHKAISAIL